MISIIVPVYNASQYLNQCIQSVIEQTYDDWECILVDDGSTDDSGDICDLWSAKDNRIVVFHQCNRGVSVARNIGLNKCNGEYVCFIDSDDRVKPCYLKDMVAGFQDDTIDLVSTGTTHVFSNGREKVYKVNEELYLKMESEYTQSFVDIIGLFYGPYSKLFRTTIIREHGILFPESYSLGEDLIFNFKYLKYVRGIYCLPISNYYYRRIEGSLSNRYRDDLFDIHYNQWKLQKSFLVEKEMWNSYSQQFFYVRLWEIVHEGVYAHKCSISKIRSVLSINEIATLKKYKSSFRCSEWMKFLIIHRLYVVIYLCNRFIKRRK